MSHCNLQTLWKKLSDGKPLSAEEAFSAFEAPADEWSDLAFRVQQTFAPETELCAIVNGKSGLCSENCRYCAQSVHHQTEAAVFPLKDEAYLNEAFASACEQRLNFFSVVTSGRALPTDEASRLASLYKKWSDSGKVGVCCSHGLLRLPQFRLLAESGVSRYHCNLETSRRYFPFICTTHTYDDKLTSIREAQAAGLEVCSGGLFGMGESWQDRADLALELRALGIRSVPLNLLSPIAGTPFEGSAPVAEEEARRIFALFRLLLPNAFLRLAGGRSALPQTGQPLFSAGANAAITGSLLTTAGGSAAQDRAALAAAQALV